MAENAHEMAAYLGEEEGEDEEEFCMEHYQGLSDHGKERVAKILAPLSFHNCLRAQTDQICKGFIEDFLTSME